MSCTITGYELPSGASAAEINDAVAKLSRTPRAFGVNWLVTVAEYPYGISIQRHAQFHHGYDAFASALAQARESPAHLLHWRLATSDGIFSAAQLAQLRARQR